MAQSTNLERAVLEKLLSGKSETFQILAEQYRQLEVAEREFTGVGFWTIFSLPPEAPRLPGGHSFWFGDVQAEIDGLKHGAGFELLIKDGYLRMLEGFSFDEPWPKIIGKFDLSYLGGPIRNEEEVIGLSRQLSRKQPRE
jgi:hypothetical protein